METMKTKQANKTHSPDNHPIPTLILRSGIAQPLNTCFREDVNLEIGVDEAGRGPLFGRLYVAATILPKVIDSIGFTDFEEGSKSEIFRRCDAGASNENTNNAGHEVVGVRGFAGKHCSQEFRHDWMKDSKRFSSQKKIREVAEYIKSNAVAWTVRYAEADLIDEINIRQAVLRTMRECCRDLVERHPGEKVRLLIDGNDFPPFTVLNPVTESLEEVESHTIEGGDNLYTCIAAASILAKVARDDYIAEMCAEHPDLNEKYGIAKNKGYGTAEHMRGIKEHGITEWHRKSYGPCKNAKVGGF